jgi:hypothetical protein
MERAYNNSSAVREYPVRNPVEKAYFFVDMLTQGNIE